VDDGVTGANVIIRDYEHCWNKKNSARKKKKKTRAPRRKAEIHDNVWENSKSSGNPKQTEETKCRK
jgi:hypothetical protein